MWRWLVLAVVATVALVAVLVLRGDEGGELVAHVRDGDTIELAGGTVVRLVQIDTPELAERECYAREARAELRRLLPAGTRVRVVSDAGLDRVDRFGRRLAYVFRGALHVNETMVARGAASVWFFDGRQGRYADELLAAARRARAARTGLWGACQGTRLDPLAPVDSRR
jgi:micrococcal nuclease